VLNFANTWQVDNTDSLFTAEHACAPEPTTTMTTTIIVTTGGAMNAARGGVNAAAMTVTTGATVIVPIPTTTQTTRTTATTVGMTGATTTIVGMTGVMAAIMVVVAIATHSARTMKSGSINPFVLEMAVIIAFYKVMETWSYTKMEANPSGHRTLMDAEWDVLSCRAMETLSSMKTILIAAQSGTPKPMAVVADT